MAGEPVKLCYKGVMLVRHSFFYLLSRLFGVAATFISLWLFSRLVPPAEFGFYVTVSGMATVANISLFQWLRITLLRFLPGHPDQAALRQQGLLLFVLLMILSMPALALMPLFSGTSWHWLLPAVLAVLWAMALADFSLDLLRSQLKPKSYLAFTLLRDVLVILFSVLALSKFAASLALVGAMVLANLVVVVLWLPQTWSAGLKLRWDRELIRQILHYGLPLSGLFTLGTLISNADRLLLPWLAGAQAAGLYGAAAGIARQSLFAIMQAVNLAAFPLAVEAFKHGDEVAARQQLELNITLLLALGLPATAALVVLSPAISQTVLGAAYAPAAQLLLPWMALATLINSLRVFYTDHAFQLAHDTRKPALILLAVSLITFPLCIGLISIYGLHGAVYGTLCGFLLALLASAAFGWRLFRLPLPLPALSWIAAATLLMSSCLWPWRALAGWLELAGLGALGIAIYGLVLLMGNVLNLRTLLWRYLRKI